MKPKILCVDRDQNILELLKNVLPAAKYDVLVASTGEEGLREAPNAELILMDLILPDFERREFLEAVKGRPNTASIPVIVLSALGSEADKLEAFELGVDDYVTKPFSARELLARIKNVMRRSRCDHGSNCIKIGPMSVDPKNYVALRNSEKLKLTRTEFEILCALVQNEGRVLSREDIMRKVWGYDFFGKSQIVDPHIKRLRSKLGEDRRMIKTVHGVGYKFVS